MTDRDAPRSGAYTGTPNANKLAANRKLDRENKQLVSLSRRERDTIRHALERYSHTGYTDNVVADELIHTKFKGE